MYTSITSNSDAYVGTFEALNPKNGKITYLPSTYYVNTLTPTRYYKIPGT